MRCPICLHTVDDQQALSCPNCGHELPLDVEPSDSLSYTMPAIVDHPAPPKAIASKTSFAEGLRMANVALGLVLATAGTILLAFIVLT